MKKIYGLALAMLVFVAFTSAQQLQKQGKIVQTNATYNDNDKAKELLEKKAAIDAETVISDREIAPESGHSHAVATETKATWDILKSFSVNSGSQQAIATDGQYFYTAKWNAGDFCKYDLNGNFISTFTIAGVSNVRDFAYDGTHFYVTTGASSIYKLNLSSGTPSLVSTITLTGSTTAARHIAYDPTANSGAGGFWVGGWNDLYLVSMTGTLISGPYTVTSVYGSAYDPITPGGPYLWLFSQTQGTSSNPDNLVNIQQWSIASNNFTGVAHVAEDLPGFIPGASGTQTIAGGAEASADLIPGKFVLMVNVQQDPNLVGVYELALTHIYAIDGGVTDLVSPVTNQAVNAAVPVTATIKNFGSTPITNISASYKVGNGSIVTNVIDWTATPLDSGQTRNYTFNETVDMSAVAPYAFKVWITLANDSVPGNDTLNKVITTIPLNDVGVTQIMRPSTGPNLTATEPIKVVVKNFGGAAQSNIPVRFYLDGTLVAEETIAGPLNPGDTVHFTFTATANLSTVATYAVSARTVNPGDANPANDSIAGSVTNQGNVILMQNGTVYACSGAFYDTGGPSGNYQNSENITMTIMPSTPGGKVQYNFTLFDVENNWDFLKIFDGPDASAPAIHTGNGFTGTNAPTTYISTHATGALTFQFTSDGSINKAGWEAQISCILPLDTNMAAVKVMGNPMPTAGIVNNYKVVVRNLGQDPISGYTVGLYDAANTLISSTVVSDVLTNLQYDTVDLAWTPAAAGLSYIYGKVTVDNDGDLSDNQTPNFNVDIQPAGTVVVNIGDSNGLVNTIPFDFFYKNSMAQTIYFPDEIGIGGGLITKVIYRNNFFTTTLTSKPIKIWIGETTQTNFTGGASKWIDADDLTLVYDGNAAFPAGQNDIEITLTTPYIYQGGNLVICTNRPMDAAYYSSNDKFYVSANAAHPQRSIEFHADATTYDPSNPPATGGNVLNIFPNTRLVLNVSGLGFIEGTVTDIISGDSIAGANIKILGGTAQTTTNANGHYAFNYQVPDTVEFLTSKFGYYNDTTEVVIIADSTVIYDIALTPLPKVAVTGVVQTNDNLGIGLQGAVVQLDGYATYIDTTDANGTFAFADVWGEKTYNITITYPGYATYTNTVVVGATAVDLDTITITEILYPAKAVTAVDMDDSVNINWKNPMAVTGTPQWIQWCADDNDDAIGTGGAANFDVAARFEPADISTLDGMQVTQIKFYPNEVAATYSVRIWTGTGATLAYEQAVTSPTIGAFNTITLTTPFTIDASQELWIGYNVNTTTGYPAGCDAGPQVEGKGNMIYWQGAWTTLTALAPTLTYNWNIYGYVDNAKALTYNAKSLQGYNVYRGLSGDEPNVASWTPIANTVDTFAVDHNWDTCSPGVYKYAVRAVYSGGVEAPAAFSNVLAKDMFVPFTVNLTTNSGDPVTGAVVTLNNVDNDTTYTKTATATGIVSFPAVWRGHYDITVQLAGFVNIDTANIDITNSGNIALQLIEIIENPYALNVSTTGLPFGQALMEWNNLSQVEIFQHDGAVPASPNAYYQYQGRGYGVVYDLTAYPDAIVEAIDFHHMLWGLSPAVFNYKVHVVNATTGAVLGVIGPLGTTTNDNWELNVGLGSINAAGVTQLGIYIEPLSGSATDAYPCITADNTGPQGASGYVTIPSYTSVTASTVGDFFIDLWISTSYKGQLVKASRVNANKANDATKATALSVNNDNLLTNQTANINIADNKAFLGFSIYVDGGINTNTPIATGVDSTTYLLTGLAVGQHVAGVRAVYTTGSSIMITDTFEIVQTYSVTFNVTSGGNPVAGATVTLTGYGTQTTNASGEAVFYGVLPAASIAYTVAKTGYVTANGTVSVTNANVTQPVTLNLQPYNVTFTVRNQANQPINGASVLVTGLPVQTTNASGQTVFQLTNGNYTYQVWATNYDTVSGNFTVNNANLPVNVVLVGITEMSASNGFSMYPNPAKDVLYINSETMIDNVKVVDMLGNVIFQGEVSNKTVKLNTTMYQPGLYLIYIESKQQMYIKKIQIVK